MGYENLAVEEDFIGLMPIDKANAQNIAAVIKDVILRLGFSIKDAKAQCYDGCSTMTGVRNGVAAIIKRERSFSERSFSAMRRIKTYLRNSMTQNWLNHTMCINVHSEKLDSFDLKLLLNEFIHKNDRRKQIFTHM